MDCVDAEGVTVWVTLAAAEKLELALKRGDMLELCETEAPGEPLGDTLEEKEARNEAVEMGDRDAVAELLAMGEALLLLLALPEN